MVGKTPGATKSVNIFAFVDDKFISPAETINSAVLSLADLPGYGFAKLSKATKSSVEDVAERYLSSRRTLAVVVLLVDLRREVSVQDRAALDAMYDLDRTILVVGTKCDKLAKGELEARVGEIEEALGVGEGQLLVVSSFSGFGIRKLWKVLEGVCGSYLLELEGDAGYDYEVYDEDEGGDYDVEEDGEEHVEKEEDLNRINQLADPSQSKKITLKSSLAALKELEKLNQI